MKYNMLKIEQKITKIIFTKLHINYKITHYPISKSLNNEKGIK